MSSNEIFETLSAAGFHASFSADHTQVYASLNSRDVSTMEVWAALGYRIEQEQIGQLSDAVVVSE